MAKNLGVDKATKERGTIAKSPADVLQLAKQAAVKIVDLKFVDLPGVWQHFSLPVKDLNEELFGEASDLMVQASAGFS